MQGQAVLILGDFEAPTFLRQARHLMRHQANTGDGRTLFPKPDLSSSGSGSLGSVVPAHLTYDQSIAQT